MTKLTEKNLMEANKRLNERVKELESENETLEKLLEKAQARNKLLVTRNRRKTKKLKSLDRPFDKSFEEQYKKDIQQDVTEEYEPLCVTDEEEAEINPEKFGVEPEGSNLSKFKPRHPIDDPSKRFIVNAWKQNKEKAVS